MKSDFYFEIIRGYIAPDAKFPQILAPENHAGAPELRETPKSAAQSASAVRPDRNKIFREKLSRQSRDFPLLRAGVIHTPHGDIATPAFIVVGTHAEVKFLTPENLRQIKTPAVLANGYHLLRRAGVIDAGGGLAKFMNWPGPTFTDSGGFQVMSLGSGLGKIVSMNQGSENEKSGENPPENRENQILKQNNENREISDKSLAKIRDEKLAHIFDDGVEFRDPYSSRIVKFTPEMSIQTQHKLGADIMMAFDELTNITDSYEYNVAALERTRKWAERSLREHVRQTNLRQGKSYQALYGCLQGATFRDLREKAARDLAVMEVAGAKFDGFGLGGAFAKENLGEILAWMTEILLADKPRHLLGLARPDDIFAGVENGADTFDCVAPTREARHGRIYTEHGNFNLNRAEFANDSRPLDETCDCPTCAKTIAEDFANLDKNLIDNFNNFFANFSLSSEEKSSILSDKHFSRKLLRAMLKSENRELRAQAFTLLSQHNVRFVIKLMENIRTNILTGTYAKFKHDFCTKYYQT